MSVFDFSDYRPFLRHYIAALPKKGRGEINRLALAIQVHPSLLSQVLSEDKNLSLEQAQLLGENLGLTTQESEYLMCLVQVQRAGTEKLRGYFLAKLEQLKQMSVELSQQVRQDGQLNEQEKSVFYSHWLYVSVWLASSVQGGQTFEQILTRFALSRERAVEILRFLLETKLCRLEGNIYKMGSQSIHLERGSPHIHKHHTSWRLRAIAASDRITPEELMYTAPISISKGDFKKIRKRLAEVIREVTDLAIQSEAEELACFHIDFFHMKS